MIPTDPSRGFRFSRIATIAWREFRHTVLTKGFILGAILFPVIMFVIIGVMPLLISNEQVPVRGTIVVVDSDGSVARAMENAFQQLKKSGDAGNGLSAADVSDALKKTQSGDLAALEDFTDIAITVDVTVLRMSIDDDLKEIKEQVQSGKLLAIIEIPAVLLTPDPAIDIDISLLVPSNSPAKTTALFARIARRATVVARVEQTGTDLAKAMALVREPQAETARLTNTGVQAKENTQLRFLIPGGFMMLMWIAAFTSANQLLTTTIEEKSSKVIEVLLSATSPLELLAGKILGQGFVSLLMLSTYGAAGIVGLAFLTMLDIVPLSSLILFFLWFLLAYFMVAAIMAAVGSAVSDLREAQSLVQPAMIVMMIPLFLWLPISENPTGWLATIASFVPPIGPFVMVLRSTGAVEPIPSWHIGIALAVNGFSTIALVWIASRVFRIGVLMQGKPPTPMELLRWARAR